MPFLDMFQKESVKVEASKTILEAFDRYASLLLPFCTQNYASVLVFVYYIQYVIVLSGGVLAWYVVGGDLRH